MRFLYLFFILLSASLTLHLHAQDPVFTNYKIGDGLHSNETYDFVQDENNYLYIAHSEGLQYFDGYKFETIDLSIIGNQPILRLHIDHEQTIWGISIVGDIIYLKDKTVHKHPKSDTFSQLFSSSVSHFFVTEEGEIWINSDRNLIEYVVTNDTIINKTYNFEQEDKYIVHVRKVGDNYSLTKFGNEVCNFPSSPDQINKTKDGFTISIHEKGLWFLRFATYNAIDSVYAIATLGSKIFLLKNDSILKVDRPYPDHEIINVTIDSKGRIWVSVYAMGITLYEDFHLNKKHQFYSTESISEVFEDHEGNFWLASLNSGLIFINNMDVIRYSINTKSFINDLTSWNDELYFSSYKSIYKFNNETEKVEKIYSFKTKDIIENLHVVEGSLWLSGRFVHKMKDGIPERLFKRAACGSIYEENSQNIIFFSRRNGLIFYNTITKKFNYDFDQQRSLLKSICFWQDTLWLGSKQGLRYSTPPYNKNTLKDQFENYQISSLTATNRFLYIGTKINGLMLYNGKQVTPLNTENSNLPSNYIKNLYSENDSTLWIITDKSVSKLFIDKNHRITLQNILLNNDVNNRQFHAITKYKGSYWIASDDGAIRLNSNEVEGIFSDHKIRILSIEYGDTTLTDLSDISLSYDENDLNFNFESVQFRNRGQLTYYYKIDGYDNSYRTTSQPNCSYYNLSPGYHTFRVKALNTDGVFTNEVEFTFKIKKHFSQTLWFITLISSIAITVIILIFNRWNRRRKRLFAQEQELTKSELKAFRSQMNPHFIFNSLNAIQNLILLEKTEEAHDYLSQFSVLMRRTLNYSKKQKISLKDELTFIRTYLQIESLRFKQKFKFSIKIEEELEIGFYQIPPFFLQPLIENAINHGLAPLEKNGELNINIQLIDEYLHFEIADNGVGRKKSKELNKIRKDHDSTGLSNIKERVALLNLTETKKIKFEIIDLYDFERKPAGTLIKLEFPVQ